VTLLDALRQAVGADHVLVDPDLRRSYETDWTGRFHGEATAVVRPASTQETAAVLQACAAHDVAVQVQGGNTGLVGGSVPAAGEVLLSLTRLGHLGEVDVAAAQVTVGAGVTLGALAAHARSAGLDVGVDLAARDSATVGGLVATNAGGIRVLRYGSMREQVAGLEAVLPDGSVVSRMAGLAKDNTGYDLVSLLCGSEGTLGVITALRLRLVAQLRSRAVALVALPDTAAAVAALPLLREQLPDLSAAELFYADGLALVRSYAHLPAPFPTAHPCFLVLECTGRHDPTDALVEAVSQVDGLLDATLASDAPGQRALWAYREQHTEAISAAGIPVKLDVSVPVRRLARLVEDLPGTVAAAAPDARLILFGHVNEGNLHVNVLDVGGAAHAVTDAVLRLVADLDGSISSEHGVGRSKVDWLGLSRSATEIATMRAIKQALDPAGRLNPGVLLPGPAPGSAGHG
jgi:FAD/FMN-containing dehydrogenase